MYRVRFKDSALGGQGDEGQLTCRYTGHHAHADNSLFTHTADEKKHPRWQNCTRHPRLACILRERMALFHSLLPFARSEPQHGQMSAKVEPNKPQRGPGYGQIQPTRIEWTVAQLAAYCSTMLTSYLLTMSVCCLLLYSWVWLLQATHSERHLLHVVISPDH